ncbi:MAG: lipopolysaccharide heptosyltransferase II [Verrucomicrobiota bacterium]
MARSQPPFPVLLLKDLGNRLVWLLARLAGALAWCFPMRPLCLLGRWAGRGMAWLLPGYRKLAERNLRIAFPEKTEAERRSLLREHFATLGANFCGAFKVLVSSPKRAARYFQVEGLEGEVVDCLRNGSVCITSHFGNWELLTKILLWEHSSQLTPAVKRAAMYQKLANPHVDRWLQKLRSSGGVTLIERKSGFHGAVTYVRGKGNLTILADQHAGDAGLWTPLFGRLASTTNLPAIISQRADAPIFLVGVATTGLGRWTARFLPVARSSQGVAEQTAQINLAIEKLVRESPADWFWVHNRWKTPKPAFLLRRVKRGVHLPEGMKEAALKPFRMLVRSPNWLGDACMAVPAVRAIKAGRPDAHVTLLCPEKLADVWESVSEVDGVLRIPGKKPPAREVGRLIREHSFFDVGILFPNSPRTAMEMWHGRIPRLCGVEGKWRKWFLNQLIPMPERQGPPKHHVEHYLQIAHVLGADVNHREVFAPVHPPEEAARRPLRLAVCPGAEYGPAKRWPLEKFAETITTVSEVFPSALWEIIGTAGERHLGEELSKLVTGANVINLMGQTTLSELMVLLSKARLLLTNDTGSMHLAALQGTPTLAVFGSTEPAWTRPLGKFHTVIREHVECSPCFLRKCPIDFRCMERVDTGQVAEALIDRLRNG